MEDKPNKEYSELEPQEVPDTYEEPEDDRVVEAVEDEDFEPGRKPAVIINVQSWAIPIVGLVMLLIGIAAGYAGRAIIAQLTTDPEAAAVVTGSPSEVTTGATNAPVGQLPTTTPQQPSPEEQEQLMAYLVSQTKHFKGDENAPVTVIEFSDFQWPYCGRFAADAGRQIDENYVTQGKVRFGYMHFAFLGSESTWAAEASECAADQDAFWEYHDLLFESQSGENQGAFNKDKLKEFAAQLDLDTNTFNECLDSGKYTELVGTQKTVAQQLGVSSTPTFAVNGQAVIGAQPYENFRTIIENLLSSE